MLTPRFGRPRPLRGKPRPATAEARLVETGRMHSPSLSRSFMASVPVARRAVGNGLGKRSVAAGERSFTA